MSCLHYIDNQLYIENVSLTSIATQYQTPCFVYSRKQIEQNFQAFDTALASVPHRICYAVKANGNLSLLNLLANMGSGFDIVSLGELERVRKAGGKPERVIFSGVGKSAHEIERAIEYGIYCFDVESEAELIRLNEIAHRTNKTINIALRVNPNVDAMTHHHIATGLKENKFGIAIDKILPICESLVAMPSLHLIGLATHIGSQITELAPFQQAIDHLLVLYDQLKASNITLRHINVGGGLGIVYKHETPPRIVDYVQAIVAKLANYQLDLIIEPGRAIMGNAGILLTKVEYLKHLDHINFAIVDAGMNDLIRPSLYEAWQNILPVTERNEPKKCYDIAGPVCESADFLGKKRMLAIHQHDLLAIDSAGAYGFSMSSNYNTRPRTAEILVDNDQARLIRRRETIEELLANELNLS